MLQPVQAGIDGFSRFIKPKAMWTSGLADQLDIFFIMKHSVSMEQDSDLRDSPATVDVLSQHSCELSNGSPGIGETELNYMGLTNEGSTCYLNSLIQTLFFIRSFRNAMYQVDTEAYSDGSIMRDDKKLIPFCLQRIFHNLQHFDTSAARPDALLDKWMEVRTLEMLNAFGWNERERTTQKDVNEFSDTLLG